MRYVGRRSSGDLIGFERVLRGEMTYVSAIAGEIPPRLGRSLSGVVSTCAAFVIALGAAAWTSDFDPAALLPQPAALKDSPRLSFDDRFSPSSTTGFSFEGLPPHSIDRSVLRELDIKIQEARGRLTQKLNSFDWRTALIDESRPPASTAVPLPRSRPVEATLELRANPPATQSEDRTLLQKFSDLLPGTLASLAPDGGLLSDGPDLAALGYDNLTAVYDISTHVVYMPNGSKLEAHSGFGNLMDDPGHVNERNIGATPPNVYDLKPRERLFHGVQALRMIPADEKEMLGRSGLLAHSYMLGPNGDSNGCVSIKNYDKFLRAFQNGEIKRLVVVASLADVISASRRASSI
jgi:hypothetical protein